MHACAMILGLALGCNTYRSENPDARSTPFQPSTVTVNRPDDSEQSTESQESVGRSNTGVNVRDQSDTTKTPFDQNENGVDVLTTANNRKQVIAKKMFSNGHNVKIITQNGKVTLRGPVQSDQEMQQIKDIAIAVAGVGNVDCQIDVNHN